ncbi:MAG: hypothetical protein IT380_25945 [Myxococcales bacterium]|nr:hypothetical protein [Myxococcales bacterium]
MQQAATAPSGAKCAVHADRAASLVCGRCGNFMCAECSEGGAQTQCSKCRELTGGSAFPFRRDDFDFSRVWDLCWSSFQREWLVLCICSLVFIGMIFAGSLVANVISSLFLRIGGVSGVGREALSLKYLGINFFVGQVVGTLVNIGVQGVALVGFYRVLMDVLIGRRADVARMFSQLRKLPTFAVTQLLLFAIIWVPSMLYFAGLATAALVASGVSLADLDAVQIDRLFRGASFGIFFLGLLLYLVVFTVVVLPLSIFSVPEIVVSDCGAVEALKRAWRIGSGHRLAMIGYSFVAGLVMMLSAFLCLVPILAGFALGSSLLVALFLAARNGMDLPAPDHS